MNKLYKTVLIGGTGGMGKLIAQTFKDEFDIYISSRNIERAKKVSKELKVNYCLEKDFKDADIVIISIPIDETLLNCERVIPLMKEGALLIEISSVKTGIVDKLKIPSHLEYISIHPLFGPLGNFKDQNIIFIPVQGKKWLKIIKRIFEKKGSIISILTYQEHDDIMGNVQVIHHFSYLCLGVYLAENPVSNEHFTRSYKKTIESFKNYGENLNIMMEIQKLNPNTKKVRKKFIEIIQKLSTLDENDFEKKINESFLKLVESYNKN